MTKSIRIEPRGTLLRKLTNDITLGYVVDSKGEAHDHQIWWEETEK